MDSKKKKENIRNRILTKQKLFCNFFFYKDFWSDASKLLNGRLMPITYGTKEITIMEQYASGCCIFWPLFFSLTKCTLAHIHFLVFFCCKTTKRFHKRMAENFSQFSKKIYGKEKINWIFVYSPNGFTLTGRQ